MTEFHLSRSGDEFLHGTMPKLIKSIDRLARALEDQQWLIRALEEQQRPATQSREDQQRPATQSREDQDLRAEQILQAAERDGFRLQLVNWEDQYLRQIHPLLQSADGGEASYAPYDEAYNEHLERLHLLVREELNRKVPHGAEDAR
jgi:hypothetical protein